MTFTYFSCMTKTLRTMFRKSGESRHPCFAPNIRVKVFNISPVGKTLVACFLLMPFIRWRKLLSIPALMKVFFKQLYWSIVDYKKLHIFNVCNWMSLNIRIHLWNQNQGANVSITSKNYHSCTLNFIKCLFYAHWNNY